jgi:hypothetical protein
MAKPSKARAGGPSIAVLSGSNPARGNYYISLLNVACCQVKVLATGRFLVKSILPTVVCHCVWSKNFKGKAAMARVGLFFQTEKLFELLFSFLFFVCFLVVIKHVSKYTNWNGFNYYLLSTNSWESNNCSTKQDISRLIKIDCLLLPDRSAFGDYYNI